MKKKWLFILLLSFIVVGCRGKVDAEASATAEFLETAAAALTEVAQVTPTAQPTWTASPTATDFLEISPSPAATTKVPFFAQPTSPGSVSCNDASFITDVSIPDNTELDPGEEFTKTWRLRNDGTCGWTSEYSVAFVSGNELSGKTTSLPGSVAVNQNLDFSIKMKAPLTAGEYKSYWTIRNENGVSFGDLFYVQIVVSSSATETFTPGPTETTVETETPQSATPSPTLEPSQTPIPVETLTSTPEPSHTPEDTKTP
jgi:hypothetical protein